MLLTRFVRTGRYAMPTALRALLVFFGTLPIGAVAQAPTAALESTEVGVLHVEEGRGRILALPVLSFPEDPRQIPSKPFDLEMRNQLGSSSGLARDTDARIEKICLKEDSTTTPQQCAIPPSLVANHH